MSHIHLHQTKSSYIKHKASFKFAILYNIVIITCWCLRVNWWSRLTTHEWG